MIAHPEVLANTIAGRRSLDRPQDIRTNTARAAGARVSAAGEGSMEPSEAARARAEAGTSEKAEVRVWSEPPDTDPHDGWYGTRGWLAKVSQLRGPD
jgi:hypothetical protein